MSSANVEPWLRGTHTEVDAIARQVLHALELADVELVEGGDLAVILQRLVAAGLGIGAGKGDVADLEQLRCGEKGHVRRVVEERVADAPLVDQCHAETGALGLNGAGQAGGAGADDQNIEDGVGGGRGVAVGQGVGVLGWDGVEGIVGHGSRLGHGVGGLV